MHFALYDLYRSGHPVITDSRKVPAGALFFALRGDHFDGNAYAAAALEAGAAFAVVDDPKIIRDDRYILVPDTLRALQSVARIHRRNLGIPVLAITGSNGKTTTKELVSRVLAERFQVSATRGNLNNHIGVPLTLLSMKPDTEIAVIEMGANHPGEIAAYCKIAEPDFGLITNIGKAHLEGFRGPAGIRRSKGELFDWLRRTGGTAFYPVESEALREMIAARPHLTAYSYDTFELQPHSGRDNLLSVRYAGEVIHTHLAGDYNLQNIAAALAVGRYFEIRPRDMISAIESYIPENQRSQRMKTDQNILYLDAYNANPSSMSAALENFSNVEEAGYPKVLVLGDMLELGEFAEKEHAEILDRVYRLAFTEVFLVGRLFAAANRYGYKTFETFEKLAEYLRDHP
ncbi:MAG: UDP-N-acetylmuramoyl-tripeptide--D-alanyl-D-alanine ligase, partial [Rikenellaceae bacterium]|nr:UDP-N-acetylmuramoyl-tripeptide--D-alanyl-D-alanine ligase [Rikenellaceae bacterium]